MRTGKLDDAEKAFLKAVSINPDDSMPYYNLCCLFAKKGNPNAAFLWLDRAIEKGMRDRAFMKQDLDLEPLRDDSRYKAIMSAKRLPARK
jgi:Flp pilus assembly protein TadD